MSRRQAEKVAFGRHMLYAGAGKNGVTLFGVGELGMAKHDTGSGNSQHNHWPGS